MTIDWTGPDKEKLAALERMVALQGILIEQLSGFVETAMRRIHALQEILEERGTLTRAAVEARSQAMDLDSTAEIELDPKYEEFRRQRDAIRRMQEEEESPQT
jgi:hypothetical protein